MKRGFSKKQETICWGCKNCTRCSWADGIPVKGWTATKTIVRDHCGDFESYLVTDCPQFKGDTKMQVTKDDIARIVGIKRYTIDRYLSTKGGIIFVRGWLKEKGYKLYVYELPPTNGISIREFIIDKINKGGDK